MANENSEIIIFDPVCGMKQGHNYQTIIKYANWFKGELSLNSEIWISPSDCEPSDTVFEVHKRIPWVYEYYLNTKKKTVFSKFQRLSLRLKQLFPRSRIFKSVGVPLDVLNHSYSQRLVKKALLKAINKKPDVIFMPGLDMYSLLSLVDLAKENKIPPKQRIVIRLMGVMETAGYFPDAHYVFLESMRQLIRYPLNLSITAETEKYANYLEKNLRVRVPVTHIPLEFSAESELEIGDEVQHVLETIPAKALKVVCLGGSRADKGYFELKDLVAYVRHNFGSDVHFIIQRMSKSNSELNENYEIELAGLTNVTLLPSYLSDHELQYLIRQSDTVFLPYSQGTYALRGSAILFDTLLHGKPIIGRAGTGFGSTVSMNGFGFTFSNHEELKNSFRDVVGLSEVEKDLIKQNQKNYITKLTKNLEGAISGTTIMPIY